MLKIKLGKFEVIADIFVVGLIMLGIMGIIFTIKM